MTFEPFNPRLAIRWLEGELTGAQTHGRNILTKLRQHGEKAGDVLVSVVRAYREWVEQNQIRGYTPDVIQRRVEALNRYKESVANAPFPPQSKFHSSILEEFLYYLFRDLLDEINRSATEEETVSQAIGVGGIRAYSSLYFAPENLPAFLRSPRMRIHEKDQDFAIYRRVEIQADGERRSVNVPVVSIECKTYIDKTMLEGSVATAEKIKMGNPYCLFIVVTEWYDVSYEVDPKYSRIDQIYVLRREKRRSSTSSPIHADVVIDLFALVRDHLGRDWSQIEEKVKREGKVL